MKKNTYLILMLMLFQFSAHSQVTYQICNTRSQSTQQNITPGDLHQPTQNFVIGDYSIDIRVYRIRQSNTNGGVTAPSIQSTISGLNSNFNSNMSFSWDGIIIDIDDDVLYNVNSTIPEAGFNFDIFDAVSSSQHIDIYFYDKDFNDIAGGLVSGFSDGIANGTRLVISDFGNNGNVVTHEIGHILGLFHTFHSTFGNGASDGGENADGYVNPNDPNVMNVTHRELVECATFTLPNNGSGSTGDFVDDTAPDIFEDISIDPMICTAVVEPTFDHCEETPNMFTTEYPPGDITNYMRGYSSMDPTFPCWDHFTAGQYRRMKSFITLQSHLNQLLSTAEDSCTALGNAILETFTVDISQCNAYFINVPLGMTDDYDVRLELGSTVSVLNEGMNQFSLPTTGERITTYSLIIIRSVGLNNIQREICFDVESDLPIDSCTRSTKLYPNPASENIYLEGNLSDVYKVEIVTIAGSKIKRPTILLSEIEKGINIQDVKKGIYFANLYDRNGVFLQTIPFIKK